MNTSPQASNIVYYAFSVDKKLRINSWSKELEKIYGKSFSEVLGVPYHELIPRIIKDDKDAVMQAIKNGRPITLKSYQMICFYGESKADIHITPLKDKSDMISGVNIVIRAHPPCAMWERQKQTQKFIDIGKNAATLAHGVRSPLNAIKGAVVYLREKYANEKKLIEFTKIIEEEISRLDNFISRFLSTSIYDEAEEIDINFVLKKIEVLTSLQAQSYKIDTIFEYSNTSPVIRINPFHLEQAILNVINNAIEAMPSGGQLVVKTHREIRSGTEFGLIEISDTGSGMIKNRNHNAALLSKDKGRGLGLFITREILRSRGGHLEVKSKKNFGTTVKLYLPVINNG
jgi:two-component system nitrogen regulation sensor histidine kinase GlnL